MQSLCYEYQFSLVLKFRTNYHYKNFALGHTLKESLRECRNGVFPKRCESKEFSHEICEGSYTL